MSQFLNKKKIKVAHSLQQLQDELILTLKDRPILKGNQIDEEQDFLENEQVQINNKMKHNAQMRKKIKQMADPTTSHLEAKQGGKGNILPHYDDTSYKNDQTQIGQNGQVKQKKSRPFKNTGNDFLTAQQSKITKLGAEYNPIKIKKSNKKTSTQNSAKSLLSFLDSTAQDQIIAEQKQQANTQKVFDQALQSIRKKRILQFNAKKQVQTVDISSILGINEQQQLLNKAMQKARKRNQKPNLLDMIKQEENSQNQNLQKGKSQKQKKVQIQLNPISYRMDDKKYKRIDFDLKGIQSGTTSAMFYKLPSQRLVKKEETEEDIPQSFKEITKQELEKMKQQLSFMQDKQLGIGLAHTLGYLRENSLLGHQQETGRSTDKSGLNVNSPGDRIKLQYRNTSGKLMKPKEAYRYMCATFHGQGPGKNKVEKRKRRELEEMRMKERSNTDGQLMNLLSQHQRRSNQSHMVLDFGKKANNTKTQ